MRKLRVTIEINADQYQDENGVKAIDFARQDIFDMFFQNATTQIHFFMMENCVLAEKGDVVAQAAMKHYESQLNILNQGRESFRCEFIESER